MSCFVRAACPVITHAARHAAVRWPAFGASISQGLQIMGAWKGSAYASHHAPAEEGACFRIRPRPLTPDVRSAAPLHPHRALLRREPAINDDYQADRPPH